MGKGKDTTHLGLNGFNPFFGVPARGVPAADAPSSLRSRSRRFRSASRSSAWRTASMFAARLRRLTSARRSSRLGSRSGSAFFAGSLASTAAICASSAAASFQSWRRAASMRICFRRACSPASAALEDLSCRFLASIALMSLCDVCGWSGGVGGHTDGLDAPR